MRAFMPNTAKKVLDVGCGNGAFAQGLNSSGNLEVWGVEFMEDEAQEASQVLHKVLSGSIESQLEKLPDGYFDAIFFNDVLEHLTDPYRVLQLIKSKLVKGGVVISSIPNVRYHNTFIKVLLKKDWQYEKHGVMDHTHMRFFTGKSIERMYHEQGYKVLTHHGINKSHSVKPLLYNIPLLFTQMDIRYPQYATVATPE